eukprot:TRINITY_DN561_c0_g1_i2.p1 TRINITY_DN561_c0_g1~~TRINITY_DN561_c0_g1_i2.p1  ORF type:complete len:681 (-),score=142.19 TRINITY_DN561_c0_g1_i2:852-2894(-)
MLPLVEQDDKLLFVAVCCLTTLVVAWKRTQCGPGDQVTQWGLKVDPNNLLPEYPRPQLVRNGASWKNLNGLWQWQAAQPNEEPAFGKTLSGEILVPFPVESCLSGIGETYKWQLYRTLFDGPACSGCRTLLRFGAVDWQTTVWLNGHLLGNHTGGYDGFFFELTSLLRGSDNELIVRVYDPSDEGFQPNGKQRISAITNPGGDTYTPSSGIWQTVWLEYVPAGYIESLTILADTRSLTISAQVDGPISGEVQFDVLDGSTVVATKVANASESINIVVPNPHLWQPSDPYLYNLRVTISTEVIESYFGMRSFQLGHYWYPGSPDTGILQGIDRPGNDMPGYPITLSSADPSLCYNLCKTTANCASWAYAVPGCDSYSKPTCWLKDSVGGTTQNKCRVSGAMATPGNVGSRPELNGGFTFLAGWLDQSFWPDGLYTAPSDEALAFDLQVVKTFGLNTVRLHQKVNSERWYWYADKLGIIVMQDAVQKYGGATAATVEPFLSDLSAMITGRYNHPCIVQWEVFNEQDCYEVFNVTAAVDWVLQRDPSRLVDTNSGGGANDLHIANVNDVHTYPWPGTPATSPTQYAMVGEFGGIGAFVAGKEWVPKQCQTYLEESTPDLEASTYIAMTKQIAAHQDAISCTIYTQITDVERECDGFLNYDRTNKFTDAVTQEIAAANQALINY